MRSSLYNSVFLLVGADDSLFITQKEMFFPINLFYSYECNMYLGKRHSGFEPTSLAFLTSVIAITAPRLPDVITLYTPMHMWT